MSPSQNADDRRAFEEWVLPYHLLEAVDWADGESPVGIPSDRSQGGLDLTAEWAGWNACAIAGIVRRTVANVPALLAEAEARQPVAPRFCFSTDEEHFRGDFDTREAALEAATEAFLDGCDEEPGYIGTVWTAEARKPDIEALIPDCDDLAEHVIEFMNQYARENYYDEAEWPYVGGDDESDLANRLRPVVESWVKEKCLAPDFWACEAVKAHEVTVPPERAEPAPVSPETHVWCPSCGSADYTRRVVPEGLPKSWRCKSPFHDGPPAHA